MGMTEAKITDDALLSLLLCILSSKVRTENEFLRRTFHDGQGHAVFHYGL